MKLETIEITTQASNNGGIRKEKRDVRDARMEAFYADETNTQFYRVGKLLSFKVNGLTLAEHLIAGEAIELPSIKAINGRALELQEGFTLALATLPTWGCVVCGSAHGSGEGASGNGGKNAKLLATNEFYYNPKTKALFTISNTCYDNYVKGKGQVARFVAVPNAARAKQKGGQPAEQAA